MKEVVEVKEIKESFCNEEIFVDNCLGKLFVLKFDENGNLVVEKCLEVL